MLCPHCLSQKFINVGMTGDVCPVPLLSVSKRAWIKICHIFWLNWFSGYFAFGYIAFFSFPCFLINDITESVKTLFPFTGDIFKIKAKTTIDWKVLCYIVDYLLLFSSLFFSCYSSSNIAFKSVLFYGKWKSFLNLMLLLPSQIKIQGNYEFCCKVWP